MSNLESLVETVKDLRSVYIRTGATESTTFFDLRSVDNIRTRVPILQIELRYDVALLVAGLWGVLLLAYVFQIVERLLREYNYRPTRLWFDLQPFGRGLFGALFLAVILIAPLGVYPAYVFRVLPPDYYSLSIRGAFVTWVLEVALLATSLLAACMAVTKRPA